MSKSNLSPFTIRKATKADVPELAKLHVDTFHETHGMYPGSPTLSLRTFQWQQIFEKENNQWFCLVVTNNAGNLVGFAKGQRYQHEELPKYHGEIIKIYLLRKYQGLGLGKKMLQEVAHRFTDMGISSMLLFGDANNSSNVFYERMGGVRLYSESGEFHGCYGWTNFDNIPGN